MSTRPDRWLFNRIGRFSISRIVGVVCYVARRQRKNTTLFKEEQLIEFNGDYAFDATRSPGGIPDDILRLRQELLVLYGDAQLVTNEIKEGL